MRIATLALVLGTLASIWFNVLSTENVDRVLEYQEGAYLLVCTLCVTSFVSVLAYWFVPFGRRPSEIPAWGDIHHKPFRRSVRAFGAAVGAAIICALGTYMLAPSVVTALEGDARVVEAEVRDVYVPPRRRTNRCSLRVTLRTPGEGGQICVCKSQRCLFPNNTALSVGQRVVLKLRDNFLGTVVDELEPA
jgi:hypothetical protein